MRNEHSVFIKPWQAGGREGTISGGSQESQILGPRMKLKTMMALLTSGKLRLLFQVTRLFKPVYRLFFVASASSSGMLTSLASGPIALETLASKHSTNPDTQPGLKAWLQLGVQLGEVGKCPEGYYLKGFLSKQLAKPDHDEVLALIQEMAHLHQKVILDTPSRLRRGTGWKLAEHDSTVIARSSRILEPFVKQAVDWVVPTGHPVRMLEVGCGSGCYMRYAAERNAQLHALGIELQNDVAEQTRHNIANWGLDDRLTVEVGDIRSQNATESYDLVTLHNLIYYFPIVERVDLFRTLYDFLKPGGELLLTTSCQGGSLGMQVLDTWMSNMPECGPLPLPTELKEQLQRAGFSNIESKQLIPGEAHHGFRAKKR